VKGENNAEYHGRKTMEFKNSIPPTRWPPFVCILWSN
jgi:hypothetical protein